MSVNYSATLGYGFLIDSNECVNMPDEKYEAFVESEYYLCIDAYCDNPTIFFGLTIFNLDPGEAANVPNIRKYDHKKFTEMMDEFKLYFPNRSDYLPRDYIMSCID